MEQIIASIMAIIASITGSMPAIPANLSSVPGISQPAPAKKAISAERAFGIAYNHAGVSRGATFDHDADLEREHGRLVWDIEFETRTHEYDYDIDAYTGAIIRFDHERDD